MDDEDLELAFQLHVLNQLAEADQNASHQEQAFLERHFPLQDLVAAGFKTADGAWTDAYDEAAVQALAVLPKSLDEAGKLDLLESCYKLAIADGVFKLGEGAVILMAARLLGLSDEAFDRFVERRGGPPGMTAAELDRVVD
jgi:uncharacterized tellurite resistance protein B-like protein